MEVCGGATFPPVFPAGPNTFVPAVLNVTYMTLPVTAAAVTTASPPDGGTALPARAPLPRRARVRADRNLGQRAPGRNRRAPGARESRSARLEMHDLTIGGDRPVGHRTTDYHPQG